MTAVRRILDNAAPLAAAALALYPVVAAIGMVAVVFIFGGDPQPL